MSVESLISRYETEKAEIAAKVEKLSERASFIDALLAEIRVAAPKGKRGTTKKRKTTRRRKGGTTVKDAILKVIAEAKGPLTPGEIIPEAAKLSGGAVPSIRTQINALTKAGALKQVPHAGRGFKYQAAGGATAAPRKPARKKRATRRKKRPAAKK